MFMQQLLNGLTLGTTYSLMALGYSMIFGVLSFINFAHGDVAMFGAYVTWYLLVKLNMGFFAALCGGIATGVIIGIVMEKIGYMPLRKAPRLAMVIVSIGFSFILAILVQLIWGTAPNHMPSAIPMKTYTFMNARFNSIQLWILIISLILMCILYIFIKKTKIGIALRATALDRDTAGLMGININNIVSLTFAIGSGLGAVSAIMVAVYYGAVYSTLGASVGMKGFTAVVLGGAGNIPGAMAGGLIMGVIESLVGGYISSAYRDAIAFFVLIIMLLFKPAGLFGKEVVKEG
jgi:branched-chain amino acid transport system permease protein